MHAGSTSLYWRKMCWWRIRDVVAAQPESFNSTAERCWCNFQEKWLAAIHLLRRHCYLCSLLSLILSCVRVSFLQIVYLGVCYTKMFALHCLLWVVFLVLNTYEFLAECCNCIAECSAFVIRCHLWRESIVTNKLQIGSHRFHCKADKGFKY